MSWYGLLDIGREAQEMRREDEARPRVSCPLCGTLLLERAVLRAEARPLRCPWDGSEWDRQSSPMEPA
jgi:hypothetical protein